MIEILSAIAIYSIFMWIIGLSTWATLKLKENDDGNLPLWWWLLSPVTVPLTGLFVAWIWFRYSRRQ